MTHATAALLRRRYEALLSNDDPAVRALAAHQLARLDQADQAPAVDASAVMNPWAHVPLAELFTAQGNRLYRRGSGFETGHEPAHGSKSGRCVRIDPGRAIWFCSSCSTGGTALTYAAAVHGGDLRQAARWLVDTYGEPTSPARPRKPRRERLVEA